MVDGIHETSSLLIQSEGVRGKAILRKLRESLDLLVTACNGITLQGFTLRIAAQKLVQTTSLS
jgi:hypothetical protein